MRRSNKSTSTRRAAGAKGLVSTACPQAVAAGLEILRQGGKAADAAVATLLTLCVTKIGAICIGGEAPAIVYDASRQRVSVLSGLGSAPLDTDGIQTLLKHGIPPDGIEAATVPAIVDLCVTLLREYGSMPFASAIAPVLRLLEQGRPRSYFDTSLRVELDAATGRTLETATTESGAHNWSTDLTDTLRTLADAEKSARGSRTDGLDAVSDCFYKGRIGDQLAEWYQKTGAVLSKRDLEAHRTRIEDPVAIDYRGYTICKCGPWTQGPWLCQSLKMLEGFPLGTLRNKGDDYYHLIIESMKLALADRNNYFGDPCFVDVPLNALLSDDYIALRRGLIDSTTALPFDLAGDPLAMKPVLDDSAVADGRTTGTVACIVADAYGNVIVMTPSGVGSRAGSGGSTGITHGTRLTAAHRRLDHANCLAAGKRPCITPSPGLVLNHNRPWLSLSTPSGLYQDQVALQMILAFIDEDAAVDQLTQPSASPPPVLISNRKDEPMIQVHQAIDTTVMAGLARRGHPVSATRLDYFRLGGALIFNGSETPTPHAIGPVSGAL